MYNFRKTSGILKTDPTAYKRKLNLSTGPGYTDFVYREAVSRLKHLLTETSVTPKLPTTSYPRTHFEGSSFNSIDPMYSGRPSMRDINKYYPSSSMLRSSFYVPPDRGTDNLMLGASRSGIPSFSGKLNEKIKMF